MGLPPWSSGLRHHIERQPSVADGFTQLSNVKALVKAMDSLDGANTSLLPVGRNRPFPKRPPPHEAPRTSEALLPLPDQSSVVVPTPSLNAYATTGIAGGAAVRNDHVTSFASGFPALLVTVEARRTV